MNDDELLQSLHALGRPDAGAPASELSRVRRSIRRRRRLRVGAAASVSTLAVAAAAIGVVASSPSGKVARIQPVGSSPSSHAPVTLTPTSHARASTPSSVPVNADSTASTAANVYADVPEHGDGTQDQDVVELRSAVDGHVIRVLVPPVKGRFYSQAVVGPSGRFVYYVRSTESGRGSASPIFRVAVDGGMPQEMTRAAPSFDDAPTPVPADADNEIAWASDSGGANGPVDVADTAGGPVHTLGSLARIGVPVGWSPDGRTLYTIRAKTLTISSLEQAPPRSIEVRAVPVSDPASARTVYSTTSQDRGDDGECGGPATAGTVMRACQLVVATDGCSALDPTLVSYIDPASGAVTASFRLDASFAGLFVISATPTPAGGIVLTLIRNYCGSLPPVVFVHGTTYTRPLIDNQRNCPYAPG